MAKYNLPGVLEGKCSQKDYTHWLYGKAAAHVKRDKKRGNPNATAEAYRMAIHKAVLENGHVDAYTGCPLRWELIRTYDNDESKQGKRGYKKKFADLPTVDHEDDGMCEPRFKICSWRTNDCKNDLTVEELVEFCRAFLEHQKAQ
ncbi:MAG: hypothetical protein ABSB84_03545 [Verrucomicrobiota bacterium]|jgi:hypothetical protein